jgi:hypothetical protein
MATIPLVLRSAPPDLALNRWRTAPNTNAQDERALAPPRERVRHFSVPCIVDERRARETDVHLTYVGSWFAVETLLKPRQKSGNRVSAGHPGFEDVSEGGRC